MLKLRIGSVLFFVLFIILVLENFYIYSPKKITRKNSVRRVVASANIIPTPTVTPTVIKKAEVTPTPAYYGFCLRVPVLMYHHVEPMAVAKEKGDTLFAVDSGIFEGQMAYLNSAGYTTIPAKQLIEALRNHSGLPGKSVVVTLDDGYSDAYQYAYPIAQRYRIILNLAIPTGLISGERYMNWGQIEEMSRSGIVNFIDHTWSHYSVNRGPLEKIKYEIETAKTQLEQHTGQKIDVFVYPYGSSSPTSINVLEQDGFIGAFSTIPGTYQCDSFILNLHRTRVGNAPLSAYGL